MVKRMMSALTVSALIVLMVFAQGFVGAQSEPVEWEVVDPQELSDDVAMWYEANHQTRGVHVLPAGEVRYLLVAWGEKPTGGYAVNLDQVTRTDAGDLRIQVEWVAPDPDEPVTQALTYPHQLIKLEAGTETITLNFMGESWLEDTLGEPDAEDPDVVLVVDESDPISNPAVIGGRARTELGSFDLVVEDGHYHLSNDAVELQEAESEWVEFAVVTTLDAFSNPNGMVVASVGDVEDGTYEEISTLPVSFASRSLPFSDLHGHWAEAAIRLGIRDGFIDGYLDGSFRPERTVSRAEFLKMLVASEAEAPISDDVRDLPIADIEDHWVAKYLQWAIDEGWLDVGDIQIELEPDVTISREEMAYLAGLALGLEPIDATLQFTDREQIASGLRGWVAAAVEKGLLQGYPDNSFRPQAGLKRSEAVAVVWRVATAREGDPEASDLSFSYRFDEDAEGWTGDFTDLPVDYEPDLYELEFGHAPLPEELREYGSGLRISGMNRSDDLFMYVKRGLTEEDGIKPNTTYHATFEVKFATNAPAGAVGVGGPPGEAVWVKVGVADEEPVPVEEMAMGDLYYLLSVDKGHQNEDGENAIRIGDVAKVEDDGFELYELKTLDNRAQPLQVTSDADGNLWIFVGTDSGFEGRTTLYYHQISVDLWEVADSQ